MLDDLVVDDGGQCQHLLELGDVVVAYTLSEYRLIEDEHGVEVLHPLRHLISQLVEV